MDPVSNPFAPGAGAPPPELAGRDELRETIRVAIERVRRGLPTKSILMVGLARLTGDEQKNVKTTAFDLQVNPANPSMSFHKLAKAKVKNFWSVRVSSDIRLIVHKTANSLPPFLINYAKPCLANPRATLSGQCPAAYLLSNRFG